MALSGPGTWAWQTVRTNATADVFLAELREATWYELKMKACNSAGCGNQSSQFATLDYDGSEWGALGVRAGGRGGRGESGEIGRAHV